MSLAPFSDDNAEYPEAEAKRAYMPNWKRAEVNSDLAAVVMVKGYTMKTALEQIGNIAGTPVAEYMGDEYNYEVLLCRLSKISEMVQAALITKEEDNDRS